MGSYTMESDPVRYEQYQKMLETGVNVSGSLNDRLDEAFDDLVAEFAEAHPEVIAPVQAAGPEQPAQ
jgi:hypothetical protein